MIFRVKFHACKTELHWEYIYVIFQLISLPIDLCRAAAMYVAMNGDFVYAMPLQTHPKLHLLCKPIWLPRKKDPCVRKSMGWVSLILEKNQNLNIWIIFLGQVSMEMGIDRSWVAGSFECRLALFSAKSNIQGWARPLVEKIMQYIHWGHSAASFMLTNGQRRSI